MDDLDHPLITFFAAVGRQLEIFVVRLKAGDGEGATRAMERAVRLCEQHPGYALRPSTQLGSSLHRVVRGCISNAIAKGRMVQKMSNLLERLDAIERAQIH